DDGRQPEEAAEDERRVRGRADAYVEREDTVGRKVAVGLLPAHHAAAGEEARGRVGPRGRSPGERSGPAARGGEGGRGRRWHGCEVARSEGRGYRGVGRRGAATSRAFLPARLTRSRWARRPGRAAARGSRRARRAGDRARGEQ